MERRRGEEEGDGGQKRKERCEKEKMDEMIGIRYKVVSEGSPHIPLALY